MLAPQTWQSGVFHELSPYSFLISLLPLLFSYLEKKNLDQLYLLRFLSSLLSFCHLQTSMSSIMWCIHRASVFWAERDPFLSLLSPIHGFLLPFKWAVDEVSLIRLSQLTLVAAVCFPSKGVLTSPIRFLYPPSCFFCALFIKASNQFHQIFWAQLPMDSFINLSTPMI